MQSEKSIAGPELQGVRLDQGLLSLWPKLSLRSARRLLISGRVLLDGTPGTKAQRLKSGQVVELLGPAQDEQVGALVPEDIVIAAQSDRLAAVVKPGGLHSQALAGKADQNLEDLLARRWPDQQPIMLTRLDQYVSGLVLVAFGPEAAEDFRGLENDGLVEKTYLAIVAGPASGSAGLKWALDTDKRKKVKLREREQPDPLRWTWVNILASTQQQALAEIRIHKGARHQIRAHLARWGHPVEGDWLYGQAAGPGPIKLHHARLVLPGFAAYSEPWFDLDL